MNDAESVVATNIPFPMADGDYEEETQEEKDERSTAETMRDEMSDLEEIEALDDEPDEPEEDEEEEQDESDEEDEEEAEDDDQANVEDTPDTSGITFDDEGNAQLSEAKKPYVPKMTSKGLPKLGTSYKQPKDVKQVKPANMPKVAADSMRMMMNVVDDASRDKLYGRKKK